MELLACEGVDEKYIRFIQGMHNGTLMRSRCFYGWYKGTLLIDCGAVLSNEIGTHTFRIHGLRDSLSLENYYEISVIGYTFN